MSHKHRHRAAVKILIPIVERYRDRAVGPRAVQVTMGHRLAQRYPAHAQFSQKAHLLCELALRDRYDRAAHINRVIRDN
jgi:hypothetical protein